MLRITSLLMVLLLALAGAASSQDPASKIDRLSRERDALKRRTEPIARLLLSYRSSGELTSSLVKSNPQGLFLRAEIDGTPLKKLAKSKKPTVAAGIPQGVLWVEAMWNRPGTRMTTECQAALQVGFQEVRILPYGGDTNFQCKIVTRRVPEEILREWKAGLEADEAEALAGCSGSHASGSPAFWSCVDGAGLSFPPA